MGHGAGLIAVKKNKKFLPQMGIELLFLWCPDYNLVSITHC
jgi:hypothetical protein